jgi:predicted nucleic acid binding AN1-type Zn finger protein
MELDIGKHCSLKECNQLDYLPFLCEKCNLYFCLEHKTPESHNCKFINDATSISICKKMSKKKNKQDICVFKKCKKNTIHYCKLCQQNFCLEHRYQEVHNCQKLFEINNESENQNNKTNLIIKQPKTNTMNINKTEKQTPKKKYLSCCIIC